MNSRSILLLAAMFLLVTHAQNAFAEELSDDEEGDLARAVQNPIASLISLPFQTNIDPNYGPKDKPLYTTNIQPVWPFEITEDWNLITRTIVPIVSQPGLRSGQDRKTGIGDTAFTAFFSPKDSGKLIWGAGPVLLLPTNTDDRLGADEWGAGPSAVFLTMHEEWVVGSLFSQVWDVGASSGDEIDLFTWQYFVNYNMADGWYLVTSPIITGNDEAEKSGNKWTVPMGGGIGKVFRVGKQPMNAQAQYFYNLHEPEVSGNWSVRFQLQFMFPK
jgi:hypothetical protein